MRIRNFVTVALVALVAFPAMARPRAVRPGSGDAPGLWLRQHASPLRSVEPAVDDTDLQPLLPLFANARVIALGDATHGTHELFALKERLIPFLVQHANVRTIALEAPYGDFQRVRDYVRTGNGDPAPLIQSSDYFFWDSDEILAVIRWARAWNAAGNPPVDIVGIDAFHADVSAARVVSFLQRVDPPAAQTASTAFDCISQYGGNPSGYQMTATWYRDACHASIMSVRPAMETKRAAYTAIAGSSDVDDAIHAARNVELGEEILASGLADRDRGMAENIEWLAENRGSGTVLVWGHNEHFGKQPYTFYDDAGTLSSGAMLAARYHSAYVAIGSIVGTGSFNAVEYDNGVGFIQSVPVDPPSPDDWASLLSAAGTSLLFVPLHTPMPSWLAQSHTMRVAGSGVVSPVQSMKSLIEDLAGRFDAVIYVAYSTPTHLRHRPEIK